MREEIVSWMRILITHYRWKKGTIKVIIGGIRIQISSINARNIELLRGNCGACALRTALHIYIRQIAAICEPCKPNCKKGLMKRLSRVFRFSLHVHLVLDEWSCYVLFSRANFFNRLNILFLIHTFQTNNHESTGHHWTIIYHTTNCGERAKKERKEERKREISSTSSNKQV